MSDEIYRVGYGRPPLEGRFRKGVSGNPSGGGRGKRVRDLESLLSGEEVVTRNGKRIVVSSFEADLYVVAKRALEGNSFTHLKWLLDVFREFGAVRDRDAVPRSGVMILPDLPDGMIGLLIEKHGLRTWSAAQVVRLRPLWVAIRDEWEAALDEQGYWQW